MTRLIFLAAAGLALANAAIIVGSAFMLGSGALIISAVVAVLFVAIAGLLVVVDRHLARLRHLVSDGGIDQAASARLRPALGKLGLWLGVAAPGRFAAHRTVLVGVQALDQKHCLIWWIRRRFCRLSNP
ncbi:hypothetical protein ABIB57_003742 [Devosia sp. UYZn731]|uniref:hypothetical protein n=1 Tax=Devosia sp. UYZn731 TaxID=3156345 RepID=UPI0033967E5A